MYTSKVVLAVHMYYSSHILLLLGELLVGQLLNTPFHVKLGNTFTCEGGSCARLMYHLFPVKDFLSLIFKNVTSHH